jgi:undecaprenyl diphosphate synthase
MERIPQHIAVIMDGNGRWARKRNLPRIMGHYAGVKTADQTIESCARLGIKVLTLYTFSTENWKRPAEEVSALMELLEKNLGEKAPKLKDNNVRFNVIGRLDKFSPGLKDSIKKIIDDTSANTGLTLNLALNYGARQEILDAAKAFSAACAGGLDASKCTEDDFEGFLYTKDLPGVDLVIRTSGEMRVSNFLLWQIAYAELYVTDTLWPDFNEAELKKALEEYDRRERRFGA